MIDQFDNNSASAPARDKRKNSLDKYRSAQLAPSDAVITALANAPENRRARQVSEWERMTRRRFDPSRAA